MSDDVAVNALQDSDRVVGSTSVVVDVAELSRLSSLQPTVADRDVSRVLRRVRRAQRRFLWAWPAGIAIAAIAVVGVGVPVAASRLFEAQTGTVGTGGEAVEGAEWLDGSANDLAEYATVLYPEWLPLPEGVEVDRFRAQEGAALAAGLSGGQVQDVTIQFGYEVAAQCLLQDEYLLARQSGDESRASNALDVLDQAPSWPAIVASDGGGIVDVMREMAAQARAGDDSLISKRIGCSDEWTLQAYGVQR